MAVQLLFDSSWNGNVAVAILNILFFKMYQLEDHVSKLLFFFKSFFYVNLLLHFHFSKSSKAFFTTPPFSLICAISK